MGWLDRFTRRSNLTREPDAIWPTRTARIAGLRRRVTELAAAGPVLVVAHFADRMAELEAAAPEHTPWEMLASEVRVADLVSGCRVEDAGCASVDLLRAAVSRVRSSAVERPLAVLAVERHPLRARDAEFEQALESLPMRTSLQFHLSLQDALLAKFFRGERMISLMSRLGIGEDEAIDGTLLTRAVARAQKKLARSVRCEIDAESAEAWLRTNLAPE